MIKREVLEGLQGQGKDESIVYTMEVSPSPVATPTVAVFDEKTDLEVTETVMSGAPTYSSGIITLPALANLVEGRTYRVEVLYTNGTSTFEPYFRVACER